MSFLFVIRGNDRGCRFDIRDNVVSLGRETSNLFQIHDPEVSRKHAEIRRNGPQDTLFDMNSSNGLFVNGKRVTSSPLHSGDQIQIGRTMLLYTRTDLKEKESSSSSHGGVGVEINKDSVASSAIVASVPKEEGTWLFDGMTDDLSELRKSPWLRKARGHLKMMYHTALVVSQTLDTDRLLHRIIDLIFDWVHIDRACVLFYDAEAKKLIPQVSRTRETDESQMPIQISQTILDYVLEKEEGILTHNAGGDERWDPGASILADSIREVICVPMRGRYGTIGVIYLDASGFARKGSDAPESEREGAAQRRLNRDHLKLMDAIAHQAALAVEDTQYYRGMVHAERLAAVGQTVAVLSHDIKNILQGISGGSFLIEKGLDEHNENLISQGWGIVQKNQGLISDMILDMLTLSKEREPSLSFENINQIAADAVELMQGRVLPLDVQLNWTPDKSIPSFCFDAKQMSRAITNVLTNAIDAASSREKESEHEITTAKMVLARVDIATKLNDPFSRVEIIIDDNGPGIPPEQMNQLFRPFQSTKKSEGTGLGLAVTQKILKEHNGNVRLTSSPLGGARFVLELPLLMSEDVLAPSTGPHGKYSPTPPE